MRTYTEKGRGDGWMPGCVGISCCMPKEKHEKKA